MDIANVKQGEKYLWNAQVVTVLKVVNMTIPVAEDYDDSTPLGAETQALAYVKIRLADGTEQKVRASDLTPIIGRQR